MLSMLWAVLQFALPTGASYLDAAIAARPSAARAVAHVEEGPGTGCQAPHSAECAVCRYLSSFASDAPHAAFAESGTHALVAPPTCVTSHRDGAVDALPLSRAPPAV